MAEQSAQLSEVGAVVRSADPDRFYAALFAPAQSREALFALLAFNHEIARVREVVSEGLIGQMRLAWWQEVLDEIAGARPVRPHPIATALDAAYRARPFALEGLSALIDARSFDLYDDPMRDLDELAAYASATGGALHGAMAQALGANTQRVALCEAVGTAWALTGAIRALRIHAARRQLYLPLRELAARGISPDQIFAGQSGEALRKIIGDVVALAKSKLAVAEKVSLHEALPAALPGALLRGHWRRMTASDFDPFRMSSDPSPFARMIVLLRASLRGKL